MPSQPICPPADLPSRLTTLRDAIVELERGLWEGGLNESLLTPYQAAFRELEQSIADTGEDHRHRFVIVIPVADSPLHLKSCLGSLLELCRAYGYGGQVEGRYRKVSVLLADDSSDPTSIEKNREIAREFDRLGLTTHYFGLDEQLALMDGLLALDLSAIVGVHRRGAFSHKGQAMMRNITYLKLAEMVSGDEPLLFYSIDADQEFKVKVATAEGGQEVCAVNFLYVLDEIFSHTDAQVLTGKVVGDPPVSPAVMVGNFLEDVIGFLREMAASDPRQPYRQPAFSRAGSDDAAYHDMADLFGFKPAVDAFHYRCPLEGKPDNAACFVEFSQRLNRFFHGEHPTRSTWFQYEAALPSVRPARTVYTGNYVFRPEALSWFIPFAPLRLRMSGPTMGRLLQAEIGGRFVCANVPMLHKRTLEATGQSEFRPGLVSSVPPAREKPPSHLINPLPCGTPRGPSRSWDGSANDLSGQARIDLCGEFERQFYGDVMLFSLQRLIALEFPAHALAESVIATTLETVRAEMREKYRMKQQTLLERLGLLQSLLDDPTHWWNRSPELARALANFQAFAANLEHNFGADSPCYARLDVPANQETWRARQLAAIKGLHADRRVWGAALGLPRAALKQE